MQVFRFLEMLHTGSERTLKSPLPAKIFPLDTAMEMVRKKLTLNISCRRVNLIFDP